MIERVCVIGAGVIGSLFAGHLAQVADVSRADPPARACRRTQPRRAARHRSERRARRGRRRCGSRTSSSRSTSGSSPRRPPGSKTRPQHARGPVPGRDADDDAQRPRRRGGRPDARRLAARLGGDVHVRDEALGHRGRVHPRHRDVAGPVRGHAARARRGDRRAHPSLRAQGGGRCPICDPRSGRS